MSNRHEIIQELGVKSTIDPEKEVLKRTEFLKNCLFNSGRSGLVLGISGGQDSLLAGILAQRAVEACRQEDYPATFHAVLLPYGVQKDAADAKLACKIIQPDRIHNWNIKNGVDAVTEDFKQSEGRDISDYNKGNIKARMRMIAQYAIAGENNLLVVGTDHAAEAVTGFFTKYGDGGADILPLSGLTKRQGRQMLLCLDVPERFYTKRPTADLLDNTPGNPDEVELGVSYDAIDDFLELKPIDAKDAQVFEDHYQRTIHKRALPLTPMDLEP